MTAQELSKELQQLKAYKKDRVRLGEAAVFNHLVPDLLHLCHPSSGVSHQAAWCLEQSFLLHEKACYPFLSQISELFVLHLNSSAMRSLCKIASICAKSYYNSKAHPIQEILSYTMREKMVEGCFQQLITTDKTANMAFSVYSLYEFGKGFDWIYPELIPILNQKLQENYGNGFNSSAKKILAKIES